MIRGTGSGLLGMVCVTILISYWFNRSNALMTSIPILLSILLMLVTFVLLEAAYLHPRRQKRYRSDPVQL